MAHQFFLWISTLLVAIAGMSGAVHLRSGKRSPWTFLWMLAAFAAQLTFLKVRGDMRGACPMRDTGEILVFLGTSLTFFYLIIGPTYRLSLLGVFTAPLVTLLQAVAMLPGIMDRDPFHITKVNSWLEMHASLSILGFGALGTAAIAALMFLILDHLLKEHETRSSLFQNLPPVRLLRTSLIRLLWLGEILLSLGLIAGLRISHDPSSNVRLHLLISSLVWLAYAILLAYSHLRGMPGRKLSKLTLALFLTALLTFFLI